MRLTLTSSTRPALATMLLCLLLAACGGGGSTGNDDGDGGNNPPPGGGNNNPTPVAALQVSMLSTGDGYGNDLNSFSPGTGHLSLGGTVTWNNASGVVHNVTFQTAGAPDNVANLTSGGATRTFGTEGTFSYQCTNHPGMSGSIVVHP